MLELGRRDVNSAIPLGMDMVGMAGLWVRGAMVYAGERESKQLGQTVCLPQTLGKEHTRRNVIVVDWPVTKRFAAQIAVGDGGTTHRQKIIHSRLGHRNLIA